MNIFERVKEQLSARDVAERYGVKVSRNGMACCPFHNDRHPSMKVDKNYHCFACGAGGDAIDFVARMFGLSQYEAAKKLIEDFALPIEVSASGRAGKPKNYQVPKISEQRQKELHLTQMEQQFQNWIGKAMDILISYHRLLDFWKEEYKPDMGQTDWHPLFVEALQNTGKIDDYLDILLSSDTEEKVELFITKQREVQMIERRIEEYQRRSLTDFGRKSEECRKLCG